MSRIGDDVDAALFEDGWIFPNSGPILRWVENLITDPRQLRSLRWELLASRTVATCGEPHELIFGPSEERRRLLQEARNAGLTRYPSETIYFTFTTRIMDLPPHYRAGAKGVVGFLAGQVDRVLGGHRFQSCAALFQSASF